MSAAVQPFRRLEGRAAPMPIDNVDTDAIIPSRESRSVSRDGYAEKLFANWRYTPGTRIENPDFVLNRPPYRQAKILVAGKNFGCGSSREAAAWSLVQFGIRCVIAESFGNIFRGNCIRNGVLPVALDAAAMSRLIDIAGEPDNSIAVDLEAQKVSDGRGQEWSFRIDPLERDMLLEGLDEIELTLRLKAQIKAFQKQDRQARPWVWARFNPKKETRDAG